MPNSIYRKTPSIRHLKFLVLHNVEYCNRNNVLESIIVLRSFVSKVEAITRRYTEVYRNFLISFRRMETSGECASWKIIHGSRCAARIRLNGRWSSKRAALTGVD